MTLKEQYPERRYRIVDPMVGEITTFIARRAEKKDSGQKLLVLEDINAHDEWYVIAWWLYCSAEDLGPV